MLCLCVCRPCRVAAVCWGIVSGVWSCFLLFSLGDALLPTQEKLAVWGWTDTLGNAVCVAPLFVCSLSSTCWFRWHIFTHTIVCLPVLKIDLPFLLDVKHELIRSIQNEPVCADDTTPWMNDSRTVRAVVVVWVLIYIHAVYRYDSRRSMHHPSIRMVSCEDIHSGSCWVWESESELYPANAWSVMGAMQRVRQSLFVWNGPKHPRIYYLSCRTSANWAAEQSRLYLTCLL